MPDAPKPIEWARPALDAVRALPPAARRALGFQPDRVQRGEALDDFKPVRTVGPGVYEVRVRGHGRAFRSFYVARFEEAVYVLHVFEKKTPKTAPNDLAVGRSRYRDLVERRRNL